MSTPSASELPLYVRSGAIVPMQPLTQSTDEKPDGPLTLRVFPGDDCHGELYQDDGKSYDFRKGIYLRLHFTCSVATDGALSVNVTKADGRFKPWWTSMRIEAVGWNPAGKASAMSGKGLVPVEKTTLGWAATVSYTGAGENVILR